MPLSYAAAALRATRKKGNRFQVTGVSEQAQGTIELLTRAYMDKWTSRQCSPGQSCFPDTCPLFPDAWHLNPSMRLDKDTRSVMLAGLRDLGGNFAGF